MSNGLELPELVYELTEINLVDIHLDSCREAPRRRVDIDAYAAIRRVNGLIIRGDDLEAAVDFANHHVMNPPACAILYQRIAALTPTAPRMTTGGTEAMEEGSEHDYADI